MATRLKTVLVLLTIVVAAHANWKKKSGAEFSNKDKFLAGVKLEGAFDTLANAGTGFAKLAFDGAQNKDSSVQCAGSSIVQTVSDFQSVKYTVKYKVEIINFTDQLLQLVRSEVHSGSLHTKPAPTIMPGGSASYIAHKTYGTATGAIGAVGYRIGGSNSVVAISITCPYNFNLGSNTLALGIYQWDDNEVKKMSENHIYYKMKQIDKTYPGKEVNKGESLTYVGPYESAKRKNFYKDTIPLLVNDEASEYLILGHMGASHKPTVKIALFPGSVVSYFT